MQKRKLAGIHSSRKAILAVAAGLAAVFGATQVVSNWPFTQSVGTNSRSSNLADSGKYRSQTSRQEELLAALEQEAKQTTNVYWQLEEIKESSAAQR